jgi:DNA-binding transcriptional MerR regulator
MVQPCPRGNVKCDHWQVITIGQLADYAGVTTKTVRVYHAKGLLPEPGRDSSGYRRYTAQHAIELIKIRTLADAGVPLARIRDLRAAPDTDLREALHEVDAELTARIRGLRRTQQRLRRLAAGDDPLPPGVSAHLDRLRRYGFSQRWTRLQADLWVLLFATHPETAAELLHDQAQAHTDPALRQIFLDYDRAHDLDPADPFLPQLANRAVAATREHYDLDKLPGQDLESDIPTLIQAAVNDASPAWERVDSLIRQQLHIGAGPHPAPPPRGCETP